MVFSQRPANRIVLRPAVMRCWEVEDADALSRAVAESVDHLTPWMWWARDEADDPAARREFLAGAVASFERGEEFGYGIFDSSEQHVLGGLGLHPRPGGTVEIGYWLHVAHTGRGLATQAAGAATLEAFGLPGVERVEIRCDPMNTASAAIPRRLGFTLEGEVSAPVRAPRETGKKLVWSTARPSEDPAVR